MWSLYSLLVVIPAEAGIPKKDSRLKHAGMTFIGRASVINSSRDKPQCLSLLYSSSIEMRNPMDEEYRKLNIDNLEVFGQKRIQFWAIAMFFAFLWVLHNCLISLLVKKFFIV